MDIKTKPPSGPLKTALFLIILIPLIIIFFPFLLLWLLFHYLRGKWYGFLVSKHWHPKGKTILFIYSNSPNWKEYIETNILPKIAQKATVMNWSEKSKWSNSLELKIFMYSTAIRNLKDGGNEFCPLAIIYDPWWRPRVIRFWKAFKDYKHGKDMKLKKCEEELFR